MELTEVNVKTSDGMLVRSSGFDASWKTAANTQTMELQCSILRRSVIVIRVNLRRGILMLILMAILFLSYFVGSSLAPPLPLSGLAIQSPRMLARRL